MSQTRLHPDPRARLRGDPRPFVRYDDEDQLVALAHMRLAGCVLGLFVSALLWAGLFALAYGLARMVTG